MSSRALAPQLRMVERGHEQGDGVGNIPAKTAPKESRMALLIQVKNGLKDKIEVYKMNKNNIQLWKCTLFLKWPQIM